MKLLFVAGAYTTHTSRWIKQLSETRWDIHVFDPQNKLIHPELKNVTLHTGWKKPSAPEGTMVRYRWPFLKGRHVVQRYMPRFWRLIVPESYLRLSKLIEELKPDCIHSLGMQAYSYCLLDARNYIGGQLPAPWIYSCMGSDIFYWGQFQEHQGKIKQVLEACDYFIANCERDVRLARQFGFKGEVLGLFQGGGGYPIEKMQNFRQSGPSSQRKVVAVKGFQHFAGRAFNAIESLRQCLDYLMGYTVVIYQAHPDVIQKAYEYLRCPTIKLEIMPRSPVEDMWKLFGQSRISLGVSVSDGVPNAMIEAMIMGAMPIQTDPGGATSEWINDGINGLIIPPDSIEKIASAIKRGLTDDVLVDNAAISNLFLTTERINRPVVQKKVVNLYQYVLNKTT